MDLTGTLSRQGPRSITVTRKPASAIRDAEIAPPNPLPMTNTRFEPAMSQCSHISWREYQSVNISQAHRM
jgi:hypothetical protein